MARFRFLLVVASCVLVGCKSTEDHLSDLAAATDKEAKSNAGVYDSGLLIHESLTGLMDKEVLTLSQMGRAIWWSARILENNDVPLLRADAISLMTHITLRYPLPPRKEPYADVSNVGQKALSQVQLIDEVGGALMVETHLDRLASPDRTVGERALSQLREITGQEFGMAEEPWREWWAQNRDALHAEAVQKSRGPLEELATYRYPSLSVARAVLGYLAIRIGVYDLPELREHVTEAVSSAARQALVFGIQESLNDDDPVARIAAARAARQILDPSLQEPLIEAFIKETEADTKGQLVQALSHYPSNRTIGFLVSAMADENRNVNILARRALSPFVGKDLGDDPEAWLEWWKTEGSQRWP